MSKYLWPDCIVSNMFGISNCNIESSESQYMYGIAINIVLWGPWQFPAQHTHTHTLPALMKMLSQTLPYGI